jgi:hypothetical protein
MSGEIIARIVILPVAALQIGISYCYYAYFNPMPTWSIVRLSAWAITFSFLIGAVFLQIFLYKYFTGRNRVDDLYLAGVIAVECSVSIAVGFYLLIKTRP